ncbi:MAG: hypothetical protein AAGJ81_11330 [Verrucomicrobiota bacterium]
MFRDLIAALFGKPPGKSLQDALRQPDGIEEDEGPFQFYSTFSIRDGHTLASELKALQVPFEVELDDGIESVDVRYGSAGDQATMTIFIEEENRDILDELVAAHFHK